MQEDNFSFIVRIWFEATDSALSNHAWRGSIEQVGHQSRQYFQDLNTLCQFIEDEAGLAENPLLPKQIDVDFDQPAQ
ncbi:MAG: hypothetical protein KDJ52_05145 [Anaerolineae bacterium]|nr:hypothetical protein [Anaerolineae bacterium]